MAGKSNVRLRTIGDVATFLAKLINQVNRDEIEVTKASRLGYLFNLLIGALKDSEVEDRISKIEKALNERRDIL